MAAAFALALVAGVGGCADTGAVNIPFPTLSGITKLKDKLLSKDEKEAAIKELALDQRSHKVSAIEEIERR